MKSEFIFTNNHLDVIGSDQHIYRLTAKKNEQVCGCIDYSVVADRIHIDLIEAFLLRQGVGTALTYFLQSLFPDKPINWGYLSNDGAAFYSSLNFIEKPSSYSEQFASMDRLKEEKAKLKTTIDDLLERNDHGDELFAFWNQYHDLENDIDELNNELMGKSPVCQFLAFPGHSYQQDYEVTCDVIDQSTDSQKKSVDISHAGL